MWQMLVSNDCWKKLNKEKQVEWRTSTKLDHPGKWRPGEGLCWARTGLTVSMKSTSGCFRRRIGIFHDSAAWQNNGASKASYKILLLCCPCSESTNCMPGRPSTVLVKEEKKGWPFSSDIMKPSFTLLNINVKTLSVLSVKNQNESPCTW